MLFLLIFCCRSEIGFDFKQRHIAISVSSTATTAVMTNVQIITAAMCVFLRSQLTLGGVVVEYMSFP